MSVNTPQHRPLLCDVSSHNHDFFSTSSQITHDPPAPSTPARTAEFPWHRYSSWPLELAGSYSSALRTAAPERTQAPWPERCSLGIVGKVSRLVGQQSQCGSLHEHDTNSAFPSCLSKSRLLALTSSECVGKISNLGLSHRLYAKLENLRKTI